MLYLLNMTVAGSIMFLLYFVLSRVLKNHWLSRQRYFLLKAVLVYYLIPLAPLSDFYWYLIRKMSGGLLNQIVDARNGARATSNRYLLVKNPIGLIYPNVQMIIQVSVFLIYLLGSVIVLILRIRKYLKIRRMVQQQIRLSHLDGSVAYQMLETLQKEYRLKRTIDLCILPDAMHSTMGVIRPVIILGQLIEDKRSMELIIRHELMHIKRNDFLFRIVLEFVECLQWFNPLMILMEREYEHVSELACDEMLMWHAGFEERKFYARLLVEQSGKNYFGKWASPLAKQNVRKIERIDTIMNKRIQSKIALVATVVLMGVTVWANSLNALAYNGISEGTELEQTDFGFYNNEFFVPDEVNSIFLNVGDNIFYDEQFIDEEGNIYPILEGDSINSICDHNFINGTIERHTRHLNGSCTVKVYAGQKCTRCGDVIYGSLLNVVDFAKCPH